MEKLHIKYTRMKDKINEENNNQHTHESKSKINHSMLHFESLIQY